MGKYNQELIAGFWLWEVDSMDQAVEWVRKSPNPMKTQSDIEIRLLFKMEDFAESDSDATIMAREGELRSKLESQ